MCITAYSTSSLGSFTFPFPQRGEKQSVGVDISFRLLQGVLCCTHCSVPIPSASVAQCLCCWRVVSLHERWIQNPSQQWSMSSEGACHPASISLSVLVMLHALRLHCKSGLLLCCSCWMCWSSWLLCPELLLSHCCCELLSSLVHFTPGLAEFDCWVKCSHYNPCISLQSTLQPGVMKINLLLMSESVCATQQPCAWWEKRTILSWIKLNESVTESFPSAWICGSSVWSQPLNSAIKMRMQLHVLHFLDGEVKGVYWISVISKNRSEKCRINSNRRITAAGNTWVLIWLCGLQVTSSWAGFGVYSVLFCICGHFSVWLVVVLSYNRSVSFKGES